MIAFLFRKLNEWRGILTVDVIPSDEEFSFLEWLDDQSADDYGTFL